MRGRLGVADENGRMVKKAAMGEQALNTRRQAKDWWSLLPDSVDNKAWVPEGKHLDQDDT